MKIKDGFWMRQVGGASVAVPVSGSARELKCIINLNESGAKLFARLQSGATIEDMTGALQDAYDVSASDARIAAEDFARQLLAADILEQ